MVKNSITGAMELNGEECHLLRKLDEEVEKNGTAIVGTNFGDVTVLARRNKFFAVNTGMAVTAVGVTASVAFLNLAKQLRGTN